MRRTLATTILCALLALAGCAAQPDPTPDAAPTHAGAPSAAASPTTAGTAQPSGTAPRTPAASPGEVAESRRFTLEEAARFDDGLRIEIAGTVAQEARPGMVGAEVTNGEIVVASVRIENNTDAPYDATRLNVGATYGSGKVAPMIADPSGELEAGFGDPIAPESEGVATLGFAVPFSALAKVTFVVDPHDGDHEPVSFTGQVLPE